MSWLTRLFHRQPDPGEHWLVEEKWLKSDADIFVRAAHHGDAVVLEQIWARGVDANAEDWVGAHALVVAAYRGDRRIVALLLGLGADPNIADSSGDHHTPLTAAVVGCHLEVVRQLIDAGADVNLRRRWHLDSPLQLARGADSRTIEKMLESAGAQD